ncbi:malate dehydrogenase [Arcobacter sp. CECT 9188]|uniref:malate dehydrogenase n=1 Tax=Arcobacter sp. CECT 9188 TaxID=2044505 RepID=UPI000DE91AF0|nr:malate dehydrogenase [Arcobacter sp. CECT 9188]RBQ27459.1 malate dehydrogenase [Arcobacter sp. CECT 9188]
MSYKRIGIVGVGNVGSSIAYNLALQNICDEILLKDIREDFTKAIALDISQAIASINSKTIVKAICLDSEFKDCDIVVITAGIARKPNMSRDDLLFTNSKIMNSIVKNVIKYNKDSILIIVSNPLDAMVYSALEASDFQKNRVLGMSGILDSSRMAHFIKEKVGNKKVEAMVLGGHGDDMVPLIKHTKVDGVSLTEILDEMELEDIIEKTKNGGAQIVKLLKTGSAYFAPAQSTVLMIKAIIEDKHIIYPCSVRLDGEYGYNNIVTGVPVVLCKEGAKQIIEIELTNKEKKEFHNSINSIQNLIKKLHENI